MEESIIKFIIKKSFSTSRWTRSKCNDPIDSTVEGFLRSVRITITADRILFEDPYNPDEIIS
jgi:hypothetical protein